MQGKNDGEFELNIMLSFPKIDQTKCMKNNITAAASSIIWRKPFTVFKKTKLTRRTSTKVQKQMTPPLNLTVNTVCSWGRQLSRVLQILNFSNFNNF